MLAGYRETMGGTPMLREGGGGTAVRRGKMGARLGEGGAEERFASCWIGWADARGVPRGRGRDAHATGRDMGGTPWQRDGEAGAC
jgi:hypothetical protein